MRKIHLIALIMLTVSCTAQPEPTRQHIIPSESAKEPLVFFCPRDNCSQQLITLAGNASQIDCALFDLDLPGLITFLESKNARIIIDDNNAREIKLTKLNYRSDTSSQLSHNKFCVIDDRMVWTGSFNPTHNGDRRNNNNVIVLFSRYIASNYAAEFEELWSGIHGSGQTTQYTTVRLNDHYVDNYFCPEDRCQDKVLRDINSARQSVYFMVFSFTDKAIADALIAKSSQGLDVKGIVEKQRINMKYNVYNYLKDNGVNVMPDTNKYIMHHKVFIIDNSTVITGSYNPTKSGDERNDENMLIISDTQIARQYLEEFSRLSIA